MYIFLPWIFSFKITLQDCLPSSWKWQLCISLDCISMKLKVPEMKLSAFFQTCKIIMEKSLCVFIAKKSNYLQSCFSMSNAMFSYFMVWNEVRWEWEVVTVIISLTAFESHFDPRRIKNDPRKLADHGIKKALGTIPKFHFGSVSLIQGVSWSTKSL